MTTESASILSYVQQSWGYATARWVSLRRLIQQPFTQNARKQFLRFSKPLTTDPQTALKDLERFAGLWLEGEQGGHRTGP